MSNDNFWEGYVPEPVGAVGSSIKSESPLGCNGPAQQALDKKAENARELGLDYDVKSDHRLMEQPAQQEPYCYTYTENGEEYFAPPNAYVSDDATPLYTSPPAQRTWVWLSNEEEKQIKDNCTTVACVLKSVKAKLKEKNT